MYTLHNHKVSDSMASFLFSSWMKVVERQFEENLAEQVKVSMFLTGLNNSKKLLLAQKDQ